MQPAACGLRARAAASCRPDALLAEEVAVVRGEHDHGVVQLAGDLQRPDRTGDLLVHHAHRLGSLPGDLEQPFLLGCVQGDPVAQILRLVPWRPAAEPVRAGRLADDVVELAADRRRDERRREELASAVVAADPPGVVAFPWSACVRRGVGDVEKERLAGLGAVGHDVLRQLPVDRALVAPRVVVEVHSVVVERRVQIVVGTPVVGMEPGETAVDRTARQSSAREVRRWSTCRSCGAGSGILP
jgi:hypothetical protein